MITGGAGFIGSHVGKHLKDAKYDLIVLDDLSGGSKANLPKGAKFVHGSITDTSLINALFEEHQFDYVFHLAAYAAESRSHFLRHFNYENNVLGSANLINASINIGVKCFVFCSSIAVYGHLDPPVNETLIPQPIDPYGIAKHAVEMDLKAAKEFFDLDYIIFRPHNVYGPMQNLNDPDRNVVGIFMRQLIKDEALTIVGDGEQSRAFSYIDDVAPIIAASINVPAATNQVFNLGSDVQSSINDLAQLVSGALGKELKKEHIADRKEVRHAYADHEKTRRVFGHIIKAETSLKDGLSKMAAWAKTQELNSPTFSVQNEITLD